MALVNQSLTPLPFDGITGIPQDRIQSSPSLGSGYVDGFALSQQKKRIRMAFILCETPAPGAYVQIHTPLINEKLFLLGYSVYQGDAAAQGSLVLFDSVVGGTVSWVAGSLYYAIAFAISLHYRATGSYNFFFPYPVLCDKGLRLYHSGNAGTSMMVCVYYVVEDF